jgi:polyisoprenoid-binding protein YceI
MKKLLVLMSFSVLATLFAFTVAKKAIVYKVDAQKSVIEWTGKKVLGSHNGTIKIASGSVTTDGKVPTAGSFIIDMTTIKDVDLTDADYNAKLIGHLKSPEFFDVNQNPTALFTATTITPAGAGNVTVTGKLTIKGISNVVTFPATYTVAGNTLTAVAKGVKVDRTKFNMKFGSKSFFENIGDKAIDDEFTLNITLVATR